MATVDKVIGVRGAEHTTWHAAGISSDYATLCGIDADDPVVGHFGTAKPTAGQKITCVVCKGIFDRFRALGLRPSDFA